MTGVFTVSTPYQDRPREFAGVKQLWGWSIKLYNIYMPDKKFDENRFAGWEEQVRKFLPTPPQSAHRPGVAYVIRHQGNGADYLVACYWDNENELPHHVWVREESGFRAAKATESCCVWDMDIMHRESEAYKKYVLTKEPDVQAYICENVVG